MEHFSEWENQLDFFVKDKKYPICPNCSSIVLVINMDILKNTIEYKCENCFKENEIKILDYFNTEFRKNPMFEIKPLKTCKIHNKTISYFCKTCMRANCADCIEKELYSKHEFLDISEIKFLKI